MKRFSNVVASFLSLGSAGVCAPVGVSPTDFLNIFKRPRNFFNRFAPAICCVLFASLSEMTLAQDVLPYPRSIIKTEMLTEWKFNADPAGWTAAHDCAITAGANALDIHSTGDDPYLIGPSISIEGPIVARVRMKSSTGGDGQVFWATSDSPDFNESRSQHFHLNHDNQWHIYNIDLDAHGTMVRLRLDPSEAPGDIAVDFIQLVRKTLHPLEIQSIKADGLAVNVRLKNYSRQPLAFTMDGRPFSIDADSVADYSETVSNILPFRTHELVIQPADVVSSGGTGKQPLTPLPAIRRRISIFNPDAKIKWAVLKSGDLVFRAAHDGSGARLELGGKLVGVLSPLINFDRNTAPPQMLMSDDGDKFTWRANGVRLTVSLRGDEINFIVQCVHPCEGPVLRAFGPLDQGLFPGLEYLERGEHSSSTLDIETDDHIRFAPDPEKVTMPLMAFVTDRATTALTWRDMSLRPTFATPNFLDGCEGHRASLRGTNFACTVLVRKPGPMEDAILWASQQDPLPPLPTPPRSRQDELKLCLTTLSGPPLKTADGWGHCAETNWARQPYADQASTVYRLSGQIPSLPRLVPGGTHIANDAIYFLTDRAAEWLQMRSAQMRGIIANQKPDGSFRYDGELRRGHFEDTASGYCAAYAFQLLDHAWLTGDADSLQAGVKCLDYMKHFRDPRGAQTWECPLHTPDILASAYLVHAYVRGYQLTGNTNYLERARAWAITGVPFVYQWGDKPTMAYATIAVFGATHWRAPNWMGLPVQWCGYVYADALAMLSPFDHTLDWNRIATGILTTAEQMQYDTGPYAGCEPDSFQLLRQVRNGPAINPCSLVSLRLDLEGKVSSLAVANAEGHRVTAPFPVTISNGRAQITAPVGAAYQIVEDGKKIIEVKSTGTNSIPLNPQ